MTHPSDLPADLIWDDPQMWVGSRPDPSQQLSPEFLVVCAYPRSAAPHPDGVLISFGMHDVEGAVPPREQLDALVASVRPWVRMGKPVYWHCQAGLNRSSFLAAYYLLAELHTSDVEALIDRIRARRTTHGFIQHALFNQSFCSALRTWFGDGA